MPDSDDNCCVVSQKRMVIPGGMVQIVPGDGPGPQDAQDEENAVQTTQSDYIEQQQRLAAAEHEKNVFGLREKFAWFALVIALVWLICLLMAIFFQAIGRCPLNEVLAFSVSLSVALIASSWSHCNRARHRHKALSRVLLLANTGVGSRNKEAEYSRDEFRRTFYITIPLAITTATGLFWVALFLIRCLFPFPEPRWHLSDKVLIAAATSTTVSVLGILGAVMFWLFPSKKSHRCHKGNQKERL